VTGEFVDRAETAASTFKPKLWTYVEASPANRGYAVPVGNDHSARGYETPRSDRMAEPGGTIFRDLLK